LAPEFSGLRIFRLRRAELIAALKADEETKGVNLLGYVSHVQAS
jgi:hypothetical protein